MTNVKFWKQEGQVIKWDVLEYYGYLPSAFIYNDLSLKFTEQPGEDWGKKIWALTAPNGNKVFKMTMGMSIMYAPFFGAAHGYAKLSGDKADGYSSPYKFALLMSSLFYLFFGLLFLRKILLLWFSDIITSLTLVLIVAGTNLWYYASFEAPLSHAYSFSLIAAFIWYIIRFYESPKARNAIVCGVLFGLISLIRPSNAIIAFVFLFYGVATFRQLGERVGFLFKHFRLLILLVICSFAVWIPQLLYWHTQTGHWFYFSYAENGAFYFLDPQIVNGLFSYRKGWFLYTPLMLLVVLAIPLSWRYARNFTIPLFVFVPLNIYVIFSWWCWWYGGCFGQRAFIDSFALMAIPAASLLKYLSGQVRWTKAIGIGLICLSVLISIFHTTKYYYGSIHWDSMTKEAYWSSFTKLRPGEGFQESLKAPDYEKAIKGEEED
jgi:hypothetical protein